jgi:hypothetical protein
MGNIIKKKVMLSDNSLEYNTSSLKPSGPPPIPVNLGTWNFAKDSYGTIGGPPLDIFASLFAKLMDGSYLYVLSFIFQSILVMILCFWPFFSLIVHSNPNTAIQGASTTYDAFAITCAGLFAVPSNYTCTDPTAVLLLTIETAVGKLAVAGLTALLVLKISRVPNNLVVTSRLLVHKRSGKWTLSFRIGALHFQRVRNMSIRFFCYGTDGNQWKIQNLNAGPFSEAGGVNLCGPEPWNIRHVVDENSPIKHYHFDDLNKLKIELEECDVSLSGFDATTGRSCGLNQKWNWEKNNIIYNKTAKMSDVFVKMTEADLKLRSSNKGKSWGINWKGFNAITLKDGVDPM